MTATMIKTNITETTTPHDMKFWSKVFLQGRIAELDRKLKFAEFLRSPWEHLARLKADEAPECIEKGFLPLLPAQRAVRDKLDGHNVLSFPSGLAR